MTIAQRLRNIAKEVEDTARGSSRVSMYKALADELRVEAGKVEELEREKVAKQ